MLDFRMLILKYTFLFKYQGSEMRSNTPELSCNNSHSVSFVGELFINYYENN